MGKRRREDAAIQNDIKLTHLETGFPYNTIEKTTKSTFLLSYIYVEIL